VSTRPRGLRRSLAGAPLVAAAVVIAIALAVAVVALAQSKTRLAGTNSVRPEAFVVKLKPGRPVCQTNVLVPADSAGARVLVGTFGRPGPRLTVRVEDERASLRRRGSVEGYRDGSQPTVSFEQISSTTRVDRVCLAVEDHVVALAGQPGRGADSTSGLLAGRRAVGADLSLEFVRPGKQSLAALAPIAFHRASLFRPGWVGTWTFWGLGLLVLTLVVAAALLLSVHGARTPSLHRAVLAVAVIAFLNAAIWALVMPAFLPPDEAAHYGYVESLIERGKPPSTSLDDRGGSYTEGTALAVSWTAAQVVLAPAARPPWTQLQEGELSHRERALGTEAKSGGGGYTTTAGYSPIYYGLEAGPYLVARNASVFSRLWLMRLGSALMTALTAVLAFMFVRELFPTISWAAPTAALAVAFQPMLAFMGGAVNNDNLLFVFATLELYLLARALRRGLDLRLALAIGVVLGAGIAVKPNMYALVPVAAAVVAWLALRSPDRLHGARLAAIAAASLGVLVALRYGVLSGDEAVAVTVNDPSGPGTPFIFREFLSYTWQWYLPKLSFMQHDFFSGDPPFYEIFFKGFWANFGHLDTQFPDGVYTGLAFVTVAGVGLAGGYLYRARSRLLEVLPYTGLIVLTFASFALLVNLRSYLAFIQNGSAFAQGRYLLPAVAGFGAIVVAAALSFGRRRGLVAATVMVVALACFNAFCLGLVMTRFYT
jgi:hypothetical protein